MKRVHVALLMIAAAAGGGLLVKWQTNKAPADVPVAAPTPAAPALPPVVPAQESKPAAPPPKPSPMRRTAAKPPIQEVAANVPPPTPPAEVPAPAPAPEPAPAPPPQPAANLPALPPPPPPKVTLTAGTLITVRTVESLSSERNQSGDTFTATLDQPLVVDGYVIAERGAWVEGRVVSAQRAGRVSGLSDLAVELVHLKTADGQRVAIETEAFTKHGDSSKKQDAAKIGTGAAIGAIIGAIAGGGKGAAIGAGAGGAAGTGTVVATRGKEVALPPETKISFRLRNSVTLTERQPARSL